MTVLCSSDSTVCTLRVEFLITFLFYFWLGWAFIAVHRLSLVAASGGYSLVAVHGLTPRHLESSRTRDRTHVPSIGRWILNHWTPQESPRQLFCKVVGHLGWSCFLKIQFAFIWTHSFRFRYIYLPIKSCGPQAETDGH